MGIDWQGHRVIKPFHAPPITSDGTPTDGYTYDAWGNLIERVGNTPNPFTWNGAYGYEWLAEVGLYHVGARAYDPRTARWLQRDPIGVAGGHPNVYLYCGNEPVNGVDSFGYQKKPCIKTLVFTGDKLKFYDETGKLVHTMTAYSGMPSSTPADQAEKDFGPIPEGTYWINPSQVSQATWVPWKWRNNPRYHAPSRSWGRYRVPLHPDPNTDTKGRGGFFIHGGSEYGSAGCIDLGPDDEVIHNLIKQRGCPKIKLVVKYRNNHISVPRPPSPISRGNPFRRTDLAY